MRECHSDGLPEYTDPHYKQFVQDMQDTGLEVEHYNGRNFYEGPAVRCDDLQDVLSNTKVKCQWDSCGLGNIVYPR
jgi:hypothetical protein